MEKIEITPELLAELKDKAENATPGPWVCDRDDWVVNPEYEAVVRDSTPDDAAYIAAANPSVIFAMIADLERLRYENSHRKISKAIHVLLRWNIRMF